MSTRTTGCSVTGIPLPYDIRPQTQTIPYRPGIPFRLEISTLSQSDDPHIKRQWTLFVLALEKFKNLPIDDPLSYFQIAGIHAYPMTAWNGAHEPARDAEDPDVLHPGKDQFGGYCNHNTITFPTWHRAYLLLFEQCVWQHMKDIVSSWALAEVEAREWHYAADIWRLPYWDWAKDSRFPEALTLDRVAIFLPASQETLYLNPYPNPLRGFDNPEKDESGRPLPFGSMPIGKRKWNIADNKNNKPLLPWSQCSGTSRYGLDMVDDTKPFIGTEGRNNVNAANKHMTDCSQHWYSPYGEEHDLNYKWRPPSGFSDAVHRMFSSDTNATWGTFASTKWWQESEKEDAGYMSLEYIHNNVHNICGGNKFSKHGGHGVGHMADVPVAAFDPLFWLHHCNIDRLTAMWQCLNWELWWDTPEPEHPQLVDGNVVDPLSTDPLLPFRTVDDSDMFWTSDSVRDWTRLNYQYEDLAPQSEAVLPNGQLNETQYQQDLRNEIDAKYRSTESFVRDIVGDVSSNYGALLLPDNMDDSTWNDYILDVVYDRYALNGSSYSIEFYLDTEFQQTPLGEIYSLGGLPISSGPAGISCGNCRSQKKEKVLSRAQVPLTVSLMLHLLHHSQPELYSLESGDVINMLKDHLRWRFIRLGGEQVSLERFPDTMVLLRMGEKSLSSVHQRLDGKTSTPTSYRVINMSPEAADQTAVLSLPFSQVSEQMTKRWATCELRARL